MGQLLESLFSERYFEYKMVVVRNESFRSKWLVRRRGKGNLPMFLHSKTKSQALCLLPHREKNISCLWLQEKENKLKRTKEKHKN